MATNDLKKLNISFPKQSCKDILLKDYMDMSVNGNLDVLGGEERLRQAAWELIQIEFSELLDPSITKVWQTIAEIALLKYKYEVISRTIEVSKEYYVPEIIESIKEAGFRRNFDIEDEESYLSDLEFCLNQSKQNIVKLNEKEQNLKQLQKRQDSKHIDPMKSFYHLIDDLEQAGNVINLEAITAYHFAVKYGRLVEKSKQQSKANGNNKRK